MQVENTSIFEFDNDGCVNFVAGFFEVSEFIVAFRTKYKAIISYHATNLTEEEVADIHTSGLKIGDKELLIQKAIKRFLPLICTIDIESFYKNVGDFFDSKYDYFPATEINFGLIKEDLQKEYYHYLLFGSETLLPLADRLKKIYSKNFRMAMSNSGKHYMIKTQIPLVMVDDCWIEGIYDYVRGAHETSLVICCNLPSKFIKHIEEVPRPIDFHSYCFM